MSEGLVLLREKIKEIIQEDIREEEEIFLARMELKHKKIQEIENMPDISIPYDSTCANYSSLSVVSIPYDRDNMRIMWDAIMALGLNVSKYDYTKEAGNESWTIIWDEANKRSVSIDQDAKMANSSCALVKIGEQEKTFTRMEPIYEITCKDGEENNPLAIKK